MLHVDNLHNWLAVLQKLVNSFAAETLDNDNNASRDLTLHSVCVLPIAATTRERAHKLRCPRLLGATTKSRAQLRLSNLKRRVCGSDHGQNASTGA